MEDIFTADNVNSFFDINTTKTLNSLVSGESKSKSYTK